MFLVFGLRDPTTKEFRLVSISTSKSKPAQYLARALSGNCNKELANWILNLPNGYEVEEIETAIDLESAERARHKSTVALTQSGHRLIAERSTAAKCGALREVAAQRGFKTKEKLLSILEKYSPCNLSDEQLADLVGVGARQIRRHLKELIDGGLVYSKVDRHRGFTQIVTQRQLTVC